MIHLAICQVFFEEAPVFTKQIPRATRHVIASVKHGTLIYTPLLCLCISGMNYYCFKHMWFSVVWLITLVDL